MTSAERNLLVRHREGDGDAFGQLVAQYRAPVYNYLFRCGCDPATRDDLLQDVFMKVHQSAPTYQPQAPLKVWIFTIAANTVRSYFRKVASEGRGLAEDATAEGSSFAPTALEVAEAQEAAQWLANAIARLPLAQREVIVLSCIERLEHKEIAQILEMPENTVKTNLRRARLALAKDRARHKAIAAREVADG